MTRPYFAVNGPFLCDPLNLRLLSFSLVDNCNLNYPFKNTVSFQDGRHSILSLVCLAISLFSFQGAISGLNPDFK